MDVPQKQCVSGDGTVTLFRLIDSGKPAIVRNHADLQKHQHNKVTRHNIRAFTWHFGDETLTWLCGAVTEATQQLLIRSLSF